MHMGSLKWPVKDLEQNEGVSQYCNTFGNQASRNLSLSCYYSKIFLLLLPNLFMNLSTHL